MTPTKRAAATALLAAATLALAGCGLIDDIFKVAAKSDDLVEAGAKTGKAADPATAAKPTEPAPPPAAAQTDEEAPRVAAEIRDRTLEAAAEQGTESEQE